MSTCLLSQPANDSYSFPLTILADSARTPAVSLHLPPDCRIAHIIQGHMEEEDGVLFPLPLMTPSMWTAFLSAFQIESCQGFWGKTNCYCYILFWKLKGKCWSWFKYILESNFLRLITWVRPQSSNPALKLFCQYSMFCTIRWSMLIQ